MNFLAKMKKHPGGQYLCFRDDLGTEGCLGKIVLEYHKTALELKVETYGKDAADLSLINYHKIAALYICAFLKYQPFYFDECAPKKFETCLYTRLANEYFIIAFLEAIFKGWNDDFDAVLSLDPEFKIRFIKYLYRYKQNIALLDPVSFSEILNFIEQKYFHRTK